MKPIECLQNGPRIAPGLTQTPAERGLDARLVTGTELLRLKAIARRHARGLPPHVSGSDLLQEAFTRALDGSRRQPPDVPFVAFLAEVMRSVKEHYWRQHRRRTRQHPKLLAELDALDFRDGERADPAASPERFVAATQQMETIDALFAQDVRARQIISAIYEGLTPEETGATYAMSRTDYDSTRKRMRRALIRVGLRNRYEV